MSAQKFCDSWLAKYGKGPMCITRHHAHNWFILKTNKCCVGHVYKRTLWYEIIFYRSNYLSYCEIHGLLDFLKLARVHLALSWDASFCFVTFVYAVCFAGDTRYQTCNWPDNSFFKTCSAGCEVVSNTGSYGTHPRCICERGFKRAPNGKNCISRLIIL